MSRAPVSVCMITRGVPSLEAAVASIRPYVEEVCLVYTGYDSYRASQVAQLADKFIHYTGCNDADEVICDFSAARHVSFQLATKPWTLWMDDDDVIRGGSELAATIEHASRFERPRLVCKYEYAHDPDTGEPIVVQWRERIIRTGSPFAWKRPVHEHLVAIDGKADDVRVDAVTWVHKRPLGHDERARNLRILLAYQTKIGAEAAADDAWLQYNLGCELHRAARFLEAIAAFERYLPLSNRGEERLRAMIHLAECNMAIDPTHRGDDAMVWARRAAAEYPDAFEGHYMAAKLMQLRGITRGDEKSIRESNEHAERAIATPSGHAMLDSYPLDRSLHVHTLVRINAAEMLHDWETAIEATERALAGRPNDPELTLALKRYRAKASLESEITVDVANAVPAGSFTFDATKAIKQLESHAVIEIEEGQSFKVPDVPGSFLVRVKSKHQPGPHDIDIAKRLHQLTEGLDVVIACTPTPKPFNPDIHAKEGVGGSETAVIEMAKRLAARGCRVRVYCDCGKEGTWDGVDYLDVRGEAPKSCDVLISWRTAKFLLWTEAKVRLVWAHDVTVPDLTWPYAVRTDRVLALSEWHRGNLCETLSLDLSHVYVTRNGIDPARFTGKVERDPHKVIYSSSPDRGLGALLDMWPDIWARVPDASLHVFYGFDGWRLSADQRNDPHQRYLVKSYQERMRTLPGVVYRGAVDQETLAREMLSAGVWAYPTWFSETSCCHPDTRVSIPGDHRGGPPTVRIADLVGKSGFPVYAFNEKEYRFQIATCNKVWQTKIAEELVELELDSGERLRVTPEHKLLTFDGDWVEAETLVPGESLRALHYRYNVAIRDANGDWTNEHRLVGEWKQGRTLRSDEHVDHADLLRLDNRPESLTVMSAAEHMSKTHSGRRQSRKHAQKRIDRWREWAAGDGREELRARLAANGRSLWDTVRAMAPEDQAAWNSDRARKRAEAVSKKATEDTIYAANISAAASARASAAAEARKRRMETDPEYAAKYLKERQEVSKKANDARWGRNHKVVAIRRIPGGPVFDMEVEGLHNFVADGVVVHNCVGAMEAQAAGLRIVTSPIAALPETVGDRGTMIEGEWLDDGYQLRFIDAVEDAMRWGGNRRELMQDAATRFAWYDVAEDWMRLFEELMSEAARGVLPEYRAVA